MKRFGSFTVLAVSVALILGVCSGFMLGTALDAKQDAAKCRSTAFVSCKNRTNSVSNPSSLTRDPILDQQLALLGRLDSMPELSLAMPKIQTLDSGKNLVVVAQVPNLNKKDFNVQVRDNVLTISAQNKIEQKTQGQQQDLLEFFNQSIHLPCAVDGSKASTTIKNNQMTITIPKSNNTAA